MGYRYSHAQFARRVREVYQLLQEDWKEVATLDPLFFREFPHQKLQSLLGQYESLIGIDKEWNTQQKLLTKMIRQMMQEGKSLYHALKKVVRRHFSPEKQQWFELSDYMEAQRPQLAFLRFLEHLNRVTVQESEALEQAGFPKAQQRRLSNLVQAFREVLSQRDELEKTYREQVATRKELHEQLRPILKVCAGYGKKYFKHRDKVRYQAYKLS